MKKNKKLSLVATSLTLMISFSALTSCNNVNVNNDSSSSSSSEVGNSSPSENTEATTYTFIVKNADGTPAVGYGVQLCLGLEFCMAPVNTDANGQAVVDPSTYQRGAAAYDIHLLTPDGNGGYIYDEEFNYVNAEFNEATTTPAEYGEITLTLKN